MNFTIESSICTNCGICVSECPSKTIRTELDSARIITAGCIECSHCGMVCPVNAVRVDGMELPPYPSENRLKNPIEQMDHLILSKRSVRKYKETPLNKEDMEAIILAGETSATATNSQHCDALLFQGEEVKSLRCSLAENLMNYTRLGLNPMGRFFLKLAGMKRYGQKAVVERFHNLLKKTTEGKVDPLFHFAPAVVILTYPKKGKRFGRTDCGIAGENMMLAAHSRNIGSCMIGFAEVALLSQRHRKKLGISKDRRVGLIFSLGYADRKYLRYPARKKWGITS